MFGNKHTYFIFIFFKAICFCLVLLPSRLVKTKVKRDKFTRTLGDSLFFWQGKKHPRKQYLTEWYDDAGMKRSANASIRALKQYKEICGDITPTQLFPTASDLSHADFIEELSVVGDDVSVISTGYTLDDKELTSQNALAEELKLGNQHA